MLSRSYRPTVLTLEDRMQPGSAIGQGLDWALVAGSILGGSLLSTGLAGRSAPLPQGVSWDASGRPAATPGDAVAPAAAPGQPLWPGLGTIANQEPLDHPLTALQADSPALGALGSSRAGARLEAVPANTLFYGGDFDGVNDLSNENNSSVTDARTYGNFYVTDPGGWDITTVFSNNDLTFFPSGGVNWEIRSGVSEHSGGTVVAK